MSDTGNECVGPLPEWFSPEQVDTVIFAFPDVQGRLMGKRMTYDHFVNHALRAGLHLCNYLMTVDIELEILPGFEIASWEQGYGDFQVRADMRTLCRPPWLEGTALVLGDMFDHDGTPVEPSPRRVLGRQIDRLAERGTKAYLGSELEFYLFSDAYDSAREKDYRGLRNAAGYSIDYHILQPTKDEDVLRRIRNEMTVAGIPVECSKGETGNGQHEINLVYAEAMEMADRHMIYKLGSKQIAAQHDKSISFMPKISTKQAGSGFHIHTSLCDAATGTALFRDEQTKAPSRVFRQFLGGLLKYARELTYFFAPTINSYKRFQPGSWAPTAVVCGHDNRTCGFRVVGHGNSLRIENRMPGADANPYLSFAATLAAGSRGIEDDLDCGETYQGNAYSDDSLPRLPESLEEATALLETSEFARSAFGSAVVDYYVHSARSEAKAFRGAVTDWEMRRYFEQI